MTLEQLLENRTALEKSLFQGVRTCIHDGSTIEYRSVAEMQAALSQLNARIADLQKPQRSRIFRPNTTRGLS